MLGALGSLAFVLVLNFFLFRVLPGDPARTLGRGRFRTDEQLEEFSATYGLDQPLPQQFLTFLRNTAARRPRRLAALPRAGLRPASSTGCGRRCCWSAPATLLAAVIGIYLGIVAAWNRGGGFDRMTTGGTLTLYSMPEWWLGLLLIATFAVGVGPIPGHLPDRGAALGRRRPGLPGPALLDTAWHLALPVLTITLVYLADYSLIMRSSLLDEIGEDYLVTARAKGLRDVEVRRRHATRNALLPTTTVIALNIGFVVSGCDHDRDGLLDPRAGPARPPRR